jgi:hypothetical protein
MSFYLGKAGLKNAPENTLPLSLKNLKKAGRRGYDFTLYTKDLSVAKLTPEWFRKTFPTALNIMLKMDYGNLDEKPTTQLVKEGKYDDRIVIAKENEQLSGKVHKLKILLDDSWVHVSL